MLFVNNVYCLPEGNRACNGTNLRFDDCVIFIERFSFANITQLKSAVGL